MSAKRGRSGENDKSLSVRLSGSLRQYIEEQAAERKVSMSDVAREMLEKALNIEDDGERLERIEAQLLRVVLDQAKLHEALSKVSFLLLLYTAPSSAQDEKALRSKRAQVSKFLDGLFATGERA